MKTQALRLHSARRGSFAIVIDPATRELPVRLHILPPSGFKARAKDSRSWITFIYDAEQLLSDFAAQARELPIDYDHQSLSAAEKAGPVPAAGWIGGLDFDTSGGYARVASFTPRAAEALLAAEYRDVSPVFRTLWESETVARIVGIDSVALTNDPALVLHQMSRDAGDDEAADVEVAAAASAADNAAAPERLATSTEAASTAADADTQMLEQLKTLLGLAADATAEAALSAIESLKSNAAARAEIAAAAGAEATADAPAIVAAARAGFVEQTALAAAVARAEAAESQVAAAAQRATDAEAALAAFRAEVTERETVAEVDAAIAACKLLPAQRDAMLAFARKDREAFRTFVAAAPAHGLTQTIVAGRRADNESETHGLTDAQLAECKRLGIKPQTFAAVLATQHA